VDEAGTPVMQADHEVTCQILGDARLLGLEASNNSDMSDYSDNKHRVFHGRMIAYIQVGDTPGEVMLRFSANWLKPAEAKLIVQ
jgi:hypothetical protein